MPRPYGLLNLSRYLEPEDQPPGRLMAALISVDASVGSHDRSRR